MSCEVGLPVSFWISATCQQESIPGLPCENPLPKPLRDRCSFCTVFPDFMQISLVFEGFRVSIYVVILILSCYLLAGCRLVDQLQSDQHRQHTNNEFLLQAGRLSCQPTNSVIALKMIRFQCTTEQTIRTHN